MIMNSKRIRGLSGLNRKQFSEKYGVPVRTLENWDSGKSSPPDWILAMLERVVREDAEKEDQEKGTV